MADQPIEQLDIEAALQSLESLPAEVADDLSSVVFPEGLDAPESFEMDGNGAMVPVYPEDDLMPARSSPGFSENIAENMDEKELAVIADELLERIDEDEESRRPWSDRFRRGMEMMGLIEDEMDDGPFAGASTAVMPVISEAVTQFWSRALGEQVPSKGPVKSAVLGKPNQIQLDKAERVADYMNHEMMFLDRSWYADHSRMLFALPYSGTCFKKVYRDSDLGRNASIFVNGEDFITNYQFVDLDTAPRYTHRIWRTKNEIKRAQVQGIYRDVDLTGTAGGDDELPEATDLRFEVTDFDADTSDFDDSRLEIMEVYVEWDLGEDPNGIALPYIITIEKNSEQVLSIYRGWKEGDPLQRRRVNFVKYDYLPGPGFYGLGLLHLIGGLQQAATGSLRAIIDGAATSSLQGGFLTKDASLRDQELTIEPGVYKQVDASAEDLSKAFFTPPFNQPSPVLFQIMGFLTERAEKFAATTEIMTGGQDSKNAPVGSTLALIEQGGKVFSAIHRGLHKSLGDELRQRFDLIQEYMPVEGYPYDVEGAHEGILAEDFAPGISIVPVSDPNIFSQEQRVGINQAVYQLAQENPDLVKRDVAVKRVLIGMKVPDYEELLMENDPPPPMDPVSEVQALLRGEPVQAYPDQMHDAYVQHYKAFMDNPEFGGNPMVAQQVMGPAVALLGQRLAYLWATHAKALGAPAELLPPPMGMPEGMEQQAQGGPPQGPPALGGPEMGAMGPGAPMGQPPPPPQQADPAQLAMMAAQIAPQMASVPGMPNPQAEAENQKAEGEAQLLQAKLADQQVKTQATQAKSQLDIQGKQAEVQTKMQGAQQTAALQAQEHQAKLQIEQIKAEAKIAAEQAQAEMKTQVAEMKLQADLQAQKLDEQTKQMDSFLKFREGEKKLQQETMLRNQDQDLKEQEAMLKAAHDAADAEQDQRLKEEESKTKQEVAKKTATAAAKRTSASSKPAAKKSAAKKKG